MRHRPGRRKVRLESNLGGAGAHPLPAGTQDPRRSLAGSIAQGGILN